jgi:ubiquitin-protein ligase
MTIFEEDQAMDTVRLRRLQSDYEAMRELARRHPNIVIQAVTGNPPERYRLMLAVRSLRQVGGALSFGEEHELEVRLPHGYPRESPVCRMLSPVFHPNIAPHTICIGDHWTAAESLDRLIMRICEMLAYQSYNTKSPLNGEAAQWVEDNLGRLPLDNTEFFLDLEIAPPVAPTALRRCGNCSKQTEPFVACAAGHLLCGDCALFCEWCRTVICLVCDLSKCGHCQAEYRL